MQEHNFFPDPELHQRERYERFRSLFRAHDTLGDLINNVLDKDGERMKVRDGRERLLSMLVSTALGRGMKDAQAIVRLCLLGFGEQAMIVLRSSVNLVINLGYIVADDDPPERAEEFLAFSYREQSRFLRDVYGQTMEWMPHLTAEERERRANAWDGPRIRGRAARVPAHHYNAYRFYSAYEHADALTLAEMIERYDEHGPFINAGPRDAYVDMTLADSYAVMTLLLQIVCRYFGIERPDVFEELRRVSTQIADEEEKRKQVNRQ
jgi:Family of unknown function (DUF5677)